MRTCNRNESNSSKLFIIVGGALLCVRSIWCKNLTTPLSDINASVCARSFHSLLCQYLSWL